MDRTQRTRPARFAGRLSGLMLAVAALTACGGQADEPEAAPTDSPSATTSESPSETPSSSPTKKPTKSPSQEPSGASAGVTIKGGSVTPVAQSVEAAVGEKVTLEVTSDRSGELHVHATPEQYQQFGKGRSTVEMVFDRPGAVDVEEHESGALVLRVLVK
jgi:plastocyanin